MLEPLAESSKGVKRAGLTDILFYLSVYQTLILDTLKSGSFKFTIKSESTIDAHGYVISPFPGVRSGHNPAVMFHTCVRLLPLLVLL